MHSLGCQQITEIEDAEGGLLACVRKKTKVGNIVKIINTLYFHSEKSFISSKRHNISNQRIKKIHSFGRFKKNLIHVLVPVLP